MNTSEIRNDWGGRALDEAFVLQRWLGGSATSGTYLAQQNSDPPQNVIVKLFLAESADAQAHVAARVAAMPLSHPNLMNVLRHGRCEIDNIAMIYTISDYADEILSQVLSERALTPNEAREMLTPILDVLSYLHGKGLVHAHLKPSNILVVHDELKLSADALHLAGSAMQDPSSFSAYDAPEVSHGPISPATDVWSLGIMLVEALSQHPLVWSRTSQNDPIVPDSISHPFADIARSCLRLDPQQRCTVSDIKAYLESGRPIPAPGKKLLRAMPARRMVIGFSAALLLIAVTVATLYTRTHEHPSRRAQVANSSGIAPSTPDAQAAPSAPVKAAVATRVLPDAPSSALHTIRGAVVVKVSVAVDSSGHVAHAAFQSAGPSRYFARLALQAAQQWTFTPPQASGHASPSSWIIEFQFTQSGVNMIPTEQAP